MWRKEDAEGTASSESAAASGGARAPSRRTAAGTQDIATIGPSITIKGEVSGDEDLVIQGRVEGKVVLKKNAIVVGNDGCVDADLKARVVTIEGSVKGNVSGSEQVILRRSAQVDGNISCPRLTVEDGAAFSGGVEMKGDSQSGGGRVGVVGGKPQKAAESPASKGAETGSGEAEKKIGGS